MKEGETDKSTFIKISRNNVFKDNFIVFRKIELQSFEKQLYHQMKCYYGTLFNKVETAVNFLRADLQI